MAEKTTTQHLTVMHKMVPEDLNRAETPIFTFEETGMCNQTPQLDGSVVLFRDKLGNLIVCEAESIRRATEAPNMTLIPSVPEEIQTIDTTINTTGLQKYMIFEGSDGSKYLSPSSSWSKESERHNIRVLTKPDLDPDTIFYEEDYDEELETPSYKLDHMYARKPGEARTTRKRARKRFLNEIIIQESSGTLMGPQSSEAASQSTPSAVVSLPNSSGPPRPRILNAREGFSSPKQIQIATSAPSPNSTPLSIASESKVQTSAPTPTRAVVTKFVTVSSTQSKFVYTIPEIREPIIIQNGNELYNSANHTSSRVMNGHSLVTQIPEPSTEKFRLLNHEFAHARMAEVVFEA